MRACSLTFLSPRSTRLAVARETPARAATSSSVGAARVPLPDRTWVLTGGSVTRGGPRGIAFVHQVS